MHTDSPLRQYVAFVIDGGTAQISRYTIEAREADDARQKLADMGLLVQAVQPRWLYWTLCAGLAGVVILTLAGIGYLIACLF